MRRSVFGKGDCQTACVLTITTAMRKFIMFKNNLAVLAVIPLAGLLLSSPDILLAQELSKPGRARVSDLIQQTSADCAPADRKSTR